MKTDNERIKDIRRTGYSGTIAKCKCGFIGRFSDTKEDKHGRCVCPDCESIIYTYSSIAGIK